MTNSQVSEGSPEIERLAEAAHDAYERAAQQAGWETNPRSRKSWADVPEANKQATRAAVRAVLADPKVRWEESL